MRNTTPDAGTEQSLICVREYGVFAAHDHECVSELCQLALKERRISFRVSSNCRISQRATHKVSTRKTTSVYERSPILATVLHQRRYTRFGITTSLRTSAHRVTDSWRFSFLSSPRRVQPDRPRAYTQPFQTRLIRITGLQTRARIPYSCRWSSKRLGITVSLRASAQQA